MIRFKHVEGGTFEVVAPLPVQIGTPFAGLFLEVPEGFRFDVSVPWGLRWLVSRFDARLLEAAALHDFALSLGWPREAAAAPFGLALRATGLGAFPRLCLVLAVTIWKWR